MRIREQGQVREGQCQKNRHRKALITSHRENIKSSSQGDYNTRGSQGY